MFLIFLWVWKELNLHKAYLSSLYWAHHCSFFCNWYIWYMSLSFFVCLLICLFLNSREFLADAVLSSFSSVFFTGFSSKIICELQLLYLWICSDYVTEKNLTYFLQVFYKVLVTEVNCNQCVFFHFSLVLIGCPSYSWYKVLKFFAYSYDKVYDLSLFLHYYSSFFDNIDMLFLVLWHSWHPAMLFMLLTQKC